MWEDPLSRIYLAHFCLQVRTESVPGKVQATMNRYMFRKGQPNKAGLHPVFLKDGNRLVGHVCERWGKGAGWWFRPLNMNHWSKPVFRSASQAITAMGKTL